MGSLAHIQRCRIRSVLLVEHVVLAQLVEHVIAIDVSPAQAVNERGGKERSRCKTSITRSMI
jgi:hypothetical protein